MTLPSTSSVSHEGTQIRYFNNVRHIWQKQTPPNLRSAEWTRKEKKFRKDTAEGKCRWQVIHEYRYKVRCVFLPCDVRQVVVLYDGTASITYEYRIYLSQWSGWMPLVPDEIQEHRQFLFRLKQR